jgi:hypothetical protein
MEGLALMGSLPPRQSDPRGTAKRQRRTLRWPQANHLRRSRLQMAREPEEDPFQHKLRFTQEPKAAETFTLRSITGAG